VFQCPGLRNRSSLHDIVDHQNQLIIVVAVKYFDVDSGLGHSACELTDLARFVLIQPLDEYIAYFHHTDACRLQRFARRSAVMKEEMCDAFAVRDESSSAFNAHSGAAQGGAHVCERARTVLEGNRYILHIVSSIARNTNRISVVPSKCMPFVPKPMTHTSARLLEFETLRELLTGYASSPLGRRRIAELQPSLDQAWIETHQQLTTEIREFRRVGGRFEFSGLPEVTRLLEKSRIRGAAIETTEIRDIVLLVDRASEWREIVKQPPAAMRSEWTAVAALSASIEDFTEFLRFFRNKILPDGTLDDRASSELTRIRREIEKQKRLIQESLRGYLRRLAEGGAVQDELITIRGERFVIPVKVEQKRRVQGVVHGASSSGQTVFVEPLETIEQNNELVRLLDEEQAEVHRILLEMTRRIGENADAILAAAEILAELELQFAKARFAEDYNCVAVSLAVAPASRRPTANREGNASSGSRLLLHRARHPLLERNLKLKNAAIVPVTVELEGDHRQLVITGPNTGGKTVTLKTVGLLALMAQSGIPVPADRAEMPVFDAILADIGDYQSIEQNLSTFSAHVTNIDFISRTATPESLVILDELGSATDPEEGAALAVAISDHFRTIGCMSVISTHHTSLKVYGANTAGVINASVGFNETTLQPTYELKIGIPGASAGINIAQRLGLNPTIIASARSRLSTQTQDVAKFLDRLHTELRESDTQRAKLQAREQELEREKRQLATEGRKEQQTQIREMEKKLETLFRDFEYHAREAVNAVQDRAAAQKLSKDAERRIAKLRREFREQFDSTVVAHATGADRNDPHAQPALMKHVGEGDTVKLKSMGRAGVVKKKIDDNHFEVEIGSMKMRIAREDIAEVLARVSDSPVQAARARGVKVSLQDEVSDLNMASEINVIGQNVDDATREVERFVDRAFLAGMPRVRIVHGSGMGVLRKALRQYLQKHPHVATVTEPPQNEGGGGATVVELRV
jgi:DNA mismatch repair protein MutS2